MADVFSYDRQNSLLRELHKNRLARLCDRSRTVEITVSGSTMPTEINVIERVGEELGTMLWYEGAISLCRVLTNEIGLHDHNGGSISGRSNAFEFPLCDAVFVELGAGVGLCGMFLAKRLDSLHGLSSTQVFLTDQAKVLQNLTKNVELNFPSNQPTITALTWGGEAAKSFQNDLLRCFRSTNLMDDGRRTILFGSECVYDPETMPALVETLKVLRPEAVYLSFGRRRAEAEILFFQLLESSNYFDVRQVSCLSCDEDEDYPKVVALIPKNKT
uniref:Calmodulin-lysine N-methyltransferase n=1 Tax=Octactis speculum TaxID=3111310 RepID=A0A7S2D872_9STRA|mmetsp:Transcript_44093/g.60235  ORF Transcript_44093/g.60235 Transcript_44093/m.60235 type:complete len:273 (+) Transcript_44093:139-957(+)